MKTIDKASFIGPIMTKSQALEAKSWVLPKPLSMLEETIITIELLDLSNEDIEKLMTLLKSKKTTTHKSGPSNGVGKRCKELIKSGLGNKDVLTKIKEEFPSNNTSYACIAWYRNDMKSKGEF